MRNEYIKPYIENINEENWTIKEGYSSKGRRVKFWLEKNSDASTYLYKVPKEYSSCNFITHEIWTEYLAYQIGTFLNFDIPEAIPGCYTNEKGEQIYGILIKSFTSDKIALVEAKEIFEYSKRGHNLQDIKSILKIKEWDNFKKMLIFDCLIGNNDRHDENWGICFNMSTRQTYLSPFYDNASCLASGINEEKLLQYLNLEEVEKYVTSKKSRPPNLFLNKNDSNKYNHYEIMKYLLKTEENMRSLIQEILQYDYFDFIDDIIKDIQHLELPEFYKISENRHAVMLNILKIRKEKLKELI